MLKQIEKDKIKELIKSGFSLELISFELDIPIEQVKQYEKELKKSTEKNKAECSKMDELREKYRKLFNTTYHQQLKLPKPLSKEEIELIENVIDLIKENIKMAQGLSRKERRNLGFNILSELKKIRDYDLTIEQAEKLSYLMNSKEMERLGIIAEDKVDYHLAIERKRIDSKLADAIYIKQSQIEDLEELKALRAKLTVKMLEENQAHIGAVKSAITSKINNIEQNKVMDKIKNDISESIELLIIDLANGKIDIDNARGVIEEEAKKKVKNNPKTKYALTEEQEKRQILIQIRTAIKEKTYKYQVENPEKTIYQLHELCGGNLEQSFTAVVRNLIGRKEFKLAKDICDKYYTKKDSQMINGVWFLKSEIKNAEISSLVLEGINMHGTKQEDERFFERLEKGLRDSRIELKNINLGKSQDGFRNISLADIWPSENKKIKSR